MKYILMNLKKRRMAAIFLILGIWIGITVFSINISYVEGLKTKDKPFGLKDPDYTKFIVGSNEKLNSLEELITKQSKTMYIGISIPDSDEGENYFLEGAAFSKGIKYPSVISGKFFSTEDLELNRKVAVIGSLLKDKVYSKNGKRFINIKGEGYEVLGISQSKSDSHSIIMPLKSLMKLEGETEIRNATFICIQKSIDEKSVFDSYKTALGKDATIISMKSGTADPFTRALSFASIVVIAIAAANLINFTYLWISERRKELALRKTVGASDEDIRNLILGEIGIIAFIALIISIITGQIICVIVNNLISVDFYLNISFRNVLLSALASSVIVVISTIPAYKEAVKVEPALVLKEE